MTEVTATAKRIAPCIGAATFLTVMACSNPTMLANWFGASVFSSIFSKMKSYLRKNSTKETTNDDNTRRLVMDLHDDKLRELVGILNNEISRRSKDNREFGEAFVGGIRNGLKDRNLSEILHGSLEFVIEDVKALAEKIPYLEKDVHDLVSVADNLHEENMKILKWTGQCGLQDIGEIIEESHKRRVNQGIGGLREKFKSTMRLAPDDLMAIVVDGQVIVEREIEKEIQRLVREDSNVLILGESGSGKSTLLMKLCYEMWKDGWAVFYTNQRIDSSKAKMKLEEIGNERTAVVIDKAGLYDESFDFIENASSAIRIVMAEQDLVWASKRRSVEGHNFKELKLGLTQKEINKYMDIHEVENDSERGRMVLECKSLLAILALLVTKGKGEDSLKKIIDDIWNNLDEKEKEIYYPILLLSSYNVDYPQAIFEELYRSPANSNELRFRLEGLGRKRLISVEGGRISTLHPLISKRILREKCKGMSRPDELGLVLKKVENRQEYFDLSFDLGTYIAYENEMETLPVAISFLENCALLDPESAGVLINWGIALSSWADGISHENVLETEGKYREACELYRRASRIDPEKPETYISWGTTLYRWALLVENRDVAEAVHKYKEACKMHERAIKADPRRAMSPYNLGTTLSSWATLVRNRNPKEAILKYREACKEYEIAANIEPEHIAILDNWGLAISNLSALIGRDSFEESAKNYRDAAQKHEKATEIDPSSAGSFINWGLALSGLALLIGPSNREEAAKNYREACLKFEHVTEILPLCAKAFYGWGTVLSHWGGLIGRGNRKGAVKKYREACGKFGKALEIDPRFADALDNYGNALSSWAELLEGDNPREALNKYEEACWKHKKATEANPKHTNAFGNWGLALCKSADLVQSQNSAESAEDYEEACEKFRKATEINPENANVFCNWGSALNNLAELTRSEKSKRAVDYYEEASGKFEIATKKDPGHALAFGNWARVLTRWADLIRLENPDDAAKKCATAAELVERKKKIKFYHGIRSEEDSK